MTQKELEQLIELLPPGRLKDELLVGHLGTLTTLTAQAVMIPPNLEPYLVAPNDGLTAEVETPSLTSEATKSPAAVGFTEEEAPQQSPARSQSHPNPRALAQAEQVTDWAGNDPLRWKRLHDALLRMYTPAWERIDSRDILVAWAAAWLALTHAKRELARLEGLRHLLTERERAVKEGRQADVSFWGRLASHLQVQVPTALVEDTQAANALLSHVDQQQGVSE